MLLIFYGLEAYGLSFCGRGRIYVTLPSLDPTCIITQVYCYCRIYLVNGYLTLVSAATNASIRLNNLTLHF